MFTVQSKSGMAMGDIQENVKSQGKYGRLITTCGVGRPKSVYVPNVNNLQPSSHIGGSSSMRCMGYHYPI